jgi:AcrR family transcriptional regulator
MQRRVPQQVRSRDRVARILEVSGEIVVEHGVEAVTTRAIARAAGLPVASLYQYFADKEAVLLALVERDIAEMDAQLAEDMAALGVFSARSLVETAMRAFVKVYHCRPSFVTIWFRGRANQAVLDFVRAHNKRMARELFDVARSIGMTREGADGLHSELAVEVADRIFQIAFEDTLTGNTRVIEEGIALVTAYVETHATPAGIAGIPVPPPPAPASQSGSS